MNEHTLVTLVRRPLSEIAQIYADQTIDPAMRLALLMLSQDIKKLEDELESVRARLDDEIWKGEK